ncbi:MAG: amino acid adenylation domain-containing protein [Pseudomonadota bacterium]
MAEQAKFEAIFPLTAVQEGMLVAAERSELKNAFWTQLALTLHGPIDSERWQRACRRLIETVPALRTVVRRDSRGRPLQIVLRAATVACQLLDWSEVSSADAEEHAYLRADRRAHGDYGQPPLVSFALVHLGSERHRLLIGMHHLIADGWSTTQMLNTLLELYSNPDTDTGTPAPTIQAYGRLRADSDAAWDPKFWRDYLADTQPALPLRLQDPGLSSRLVHRRFALTAAQTEALSVRARSAGVTLATLISAAWALTLAAESGQSTLAFGLSLADRSLPLPGIEGLIGPLIRTLPLRVATGTDKPINDWLKDIQRAAVALREQPGTLEAIDAECKASIIDLVDALLVVENHAPEQSFGAATIPLEVTDLRGYEETPQRLMLTAVPGRSLSFTLQTRANEASEYLVARIEQRLLTLLQRITTEELSAPAQLALTCPADELTIVNPAAPVGGQDPLPRILEQLAREGARTAVHELSSTVFGTELRARAVSWAAAMTAHGVQPGDRVALQLPRSAELIAGMLGCWWIGAVFVPMDATQPLRRRQAILERAGCRCVLAATADSTLSVPTLTPQRHAVRPVQETSEITTASSLSLSKSAPAKTAPLVEAPLAESPGPTAPDTLAYLMFTSGSTGEPKGVAITRGAIGAFFEAFAKRLNLSQDDRFLAVTTPVFDPALVELLLPLWIGASIRVAPEDATHDGRQLAEAAADCTVVQGTPGRFQLLLESGWRGGAAVTAVCGGEVLPATLAARLLPQVAELWNVYGPTETTVWASAKRIDSPRDISIGLPLDGVTTQVCDDCGRPLPPDVAGEILIGGYGVAEGYWQQPDETAKQFLGDGPRRYASGDRGCVRDGGELHYLGRTDNQIKLRGFRIELAEIERALEAIDGIDRACCLHQPEEERLVAFQQGALPDDWRIQLAARLPDYMIPQQIITLPVFPFGPTGKLDRRALLDHPDLGVDAPGATVNSAPQSAAESLVAALWSEELGQTSIARDQNFFELGGQSLQFARLQARLAPHLTEASTTATRFAAQTVAEQALLVSRVPSAPQQPHWAAACDTFEATPFQRRLWVMDRLEGSRGTHHVYRVYEVKKPEAAHRLRHAALRCMNNHAMLRSALVADGGSLNVQIDNDCTLPVSTETLHSDEPDQLTAAIEELVQQPFSLEQAPLWRLATLATPSRRFIVITWHHAIIDGHSLHLLDAELLGLNPSRGKASLSFSQAAQSLSDPGFVSLEADRDWWLTQLASPLPVLALPTRGPRPAMQTFDGERLSRTLPIARTTALQRKAAAHRLSLNSVLLGAFAATLLRYAQQQEVVIGTAQSVRPLLPDRRLESVVGPLLNTLPIRVRCDANTTGERLMQHVQSQQLAALAHALVPFETLLADLPADRDLSRTPVYQAFFSFQHRATSEDPDSELAISDQRLKRGPARTDLTCWIEQHATGLTIEFEYPTALFEPALIAQMLAVMDESLDALFDAPCALRLKTSSEPFALARSRLTGPTCAIEARSVLELLRGDDDAVAVADLKHELTYAGLNRRLQELAANFEHLGVAAGHRVGIALDRNVDLVAVLLALWWRGASFVPIDATLPSARLSYLLNDAGLDHLLFDAMSATDLRACNPPCAMHELRLEPAPVDHPTSAVPPPLDPASVAYTLYTSGSTGEPKGVVVPHRALVNFLQAMAQRLPIDASDRLLATTTLSFDIALLELLLPLCVGGRVIVAPSATQRDGFALLDALERSDATCLQATPSGWRVLLAAGWAGNDQLTALCGGEPLDESLARQLRIRSRQLWNLYGPTESTIWSTAATLADVSHPIAIGEPIDNTQLYIVDATGTEVPPGAVGELCIGGAGLALGYWQRERLTAERFIELAATPTERVYRTGDLARLTPSGALLCLGREDTQVKIRGHRLELGEVEAALRRLPGVTDAAALLVSAGAADATLTGYLQTTEVLTPDDAITALREQLPSHAVPHRIVSLAALPTTHNGKLDRPALLQLGNETRASTRGRSAQTPQEMLLVRVAGALLGREDLPLDERFFELGGHSLLAMQLMVSLEEETGVRLPLAAILLESLDALAQRLPEPTPPSQPSAGVLARLSRWVRTLRR